jgi:tetratricopeptide (TPR) repeat protein
LVIEPDNVSVYVTLGQIYDKLYQDAVATDPVKADENFNKAMSYYQQAMAKDAKNFDAAYSVGALWYNKAAAYSIELNDLSSDYSPAGNKKYEAKKAQMEEAFNKALPLFLQAEQINPNDYNTLIALKEIYARQDKLDIAEQYKLKIEKIEKH